MSIRIKWLNRNENYDSITVYRDTKKIDIEALPESIAVLSGGEKDYLDTTAPTKTLLYYLIALKKGSNVSYSKPKPTVNVGYTGPGPQTIWMGDWRFGYFGPVSGAEFFGPTDLCALCGVPGAYTSGAEWHKFAFRGKVLYFPFNLISTNVSWNRLYALGLVFGVDGPGPSGHGNTPTNQMKFVNKDDDRFIVRLPRSNNRALFTAGVVDSTGEELAEWNLMEALTGATHGADNYLLGNMTRSNLGVNPTPLAEFQTGGLTAGCNHVNGNSGGFTVNATNLGNANRNTNLYWRPVLEWVMR